MRSCIQNRVCSPLRICASLLAALALLPGCGLIGNVLGPQSVEVVLINGSDYEIEVELYYHDDQNVISDLIDDVGTRLSFSIPAGDSASFSRRCRDLQAIQIRRAKLLVIGSVGPEASTNVQRDGTNFNCGDRLTFTFDHSVVLIDFNVTFNRTRQSSLLDDLAGAL